jgi:hypothetical protein
LTIVLAKLFLGFPVGDTVLPSALGRWFEVYKGVL